MTAVPKRVLGWMRTRKAQLALAVRVTVAAAAAYALASALHLLLPLWAVLTSLIVTQMSVGRSLKATRDYMLGTIGGAIYGGAIAVLIPHSGEGQLLALLVLAVAPLAFVAAINPSLNAATVTAVIVLLVPTMSHVNPLTSTIDRVSEVAIGAITGLLVSFLVLPSRAHSQIQVNASRLLELIAEAFTELLAGLTRGRDNDALHRIQDGIGAALVSLNATGAEAERERNARLSSGPDTGPLLRTILRLRHDVVMIGRATVVPLPSNLQARLAAPLSDVSKAIAHYLRSASAALRLGPARRRLRRSIRPCKTMRTKSQPYAARAWFAASPATSPSASSRWDFRWSRCGRTWPISTASSASGRNPRRRRPRPRTINRCRRRGSPGSRGRAARARRSAPCSRRQNRARLFQFPGAGSCGPIPSPAAAWCARSGGGMA